MTAEADARQLRYRAFVSYSRHDREEAVRLQQLLEAYVLPTALRLVAPGVRHNARPMRPVFRDEDELLPGQGLPARIREGLGASAGLLVICSPHAAASHWVDKEIREFRALGGEEVLAVLVEGVPNALASGRDAALECLPPSLRADAGGVAAPMVDWRSGALKRDGFLELVASMLSLGSLDDLIREDDRATARRLLALIGAVAAATVLAVGGVVTFLASDVDAKASRSNQFAVLAAQAEARGEGKAAIRLALAGVEILGPWRPLIGVSDAQTELQDDLMQSDRIIAVPGYGAGVTAMSVSGDARTIVAAAQDGTLRILDGVTGAQRLPPIVPSRSPLAIGAARQSSFYAVGLSPDATRVAAVAPDGTLRLWDVASGRSLASTPPSTLGDGDLTALAWSTDGARVATSAHTDGVQFWDGRRLSPMGALPAIPNVYATALAFSPDGRRIVGGLNASDLSIAAAAARRGQLAIWDAKPGAGAGVAQLLIGGSFEPTSVAWSPDGRRIASTGDYSLRIWDAASGKLIATTPEAEIGVVAWSADSKLVATGSGSDDALSQDDAVRLWDGQTGVEIGPPLQGHGRPVRAVAFTPDGAQIISAGEDATIRYWPVATVRAAPNLVALACQALARAAPPATGPDPWEATQLVSAACGRH